MNPDEIDSQLAELIIRLERLRSLYEQYFMGIERIEPGIARKDVERRMQALRKTRFPTTAKRFKFQTTVQRYNSLQQYWHRTCRDIEKGTYRKHRRKAERRFANEKSAPTTDEVKERAESAATAKEAAARDLAALMDSDVDMEAEVGNALAGFDKPGSKKLKPLPLTGKPLAGLTAAGGKSPRLTLPKIEVRESSEPGASAGAASRTGASAAVKELAPLALRSSRVPPSLRKSGGRPPAPSQRPSAPSQRPSAKRSPAIKAKVDKKVLGATDATLRKSPPVGSPLAQAKASSPLLSEARIRALHDSYSEAREKTNARAVSFEKLAKNIRQTEEKLRIKSKGKSIDFDVTIQGGRATLRPKIK